MIRNITVAVILVLLMVIPMQSVHSESIKSMLPIVTTKHKNFESSKELQDWMKKTINVVFLGGFVDLDGKRTSNVYLLDLPVDTSDCDDYAIRLADFAWQDGYYLSLALTDEQGYIGLVKVSTGYHMGDLAIIGDEIWYIEPQDSTITDIGPLD